jgi:hypothetical protein
VVLLSEGRLIYFGPAKRALEFFVSPIKLNMSALSAQLKGVDPKAVTTISDSFYVQDEYKNAADLIIEVSGGQLIPLKRNMDDNTVESAEALSAEDLELRYNISDIFLEARLSKEEQRHIQNTRTADDEPVPILSKLLSNDREYHLHATTKVTQFHMLMDRTWTALMRDVEDLRAQTAKNVVVGLLCGTVFYQQAADPEPLYTAGLLNSSVMNVTSILFFGMMYTLVSNMQSIPYLCGMNKLYRREVSWSY